MRAFAARVFVLSAYSAGAPASGQSTTVTTTTTTSQVAEAQRHIAEGMQRFQARDFAAAIHAFTMANQSAPSPDLWYNIARARELSGDFNGAVADYRRYLRDRVDPPDRAEVERRIADIERLAEIQRASRLRREAHTTLRVVTERPPAGVRYVIDGRELSPSVALSPMELPVGEHSVEVRAEGSQTWRAQVRLREGASADVYATLVPATRYRTRPSRHVASVILGGLGIASFGVATLFGVRAITADCDRCDGQLRAADRSDVFLGVGMGLAVGAVVAYFLERGSSTTEMLR